MNHLPTSMERFDDSLSEDQILAYRRDGFIALTDVFVGEELRELREAVEAAVALETRPVERSAEGTKRTPGAYELIFNQKVNLWQRHPNVGKFVVSKRLGNLAARLEGVPMRVWHD